MKNTALIKITLIFICAAAIFFSCTAVCAETDDILQNSSEKIDAGGFDFYKTAKDAADGNLDFSLQGALEKIGSVFFETLRSNIKIMIKICAVSVFAALIASVGDASSGGAADIACILLISGYSAGIFAEVSAKAMETSDKLLLFMQSLLPIQMSLNISSGSAALSAFHPSMFVSMQVFLYVCRKCFMPLLMFSVSLSVINSLTECFHIVKLTAMCRNIIKWGMGLLMTVYMGLLGVCGFSASFASGVAGKTLKYAIGNFVPLVGNVLAESAEAVVSSILLIKNALSAAGMAAVLYICLAPLCEIAVISICYKLAGSVCEPLSSKRITTLIFDLSSAITLVFSILLMTCVMFLLSIAMLMAFSTQTVR